ncbi:MAG TPA: glutaredoxin family protein [Candidatus Paceibacterota bacterium]|nr:glutaredoxin family protein [Candidatus Paceibacterota bacterium]
MKLLTAAWLLLGVALFTLFGPSTPLLAETATTYNPDNQEAQIYVFGRNDCGFCKQLFAFLEKSETPFVYLNIQTDTLAAELYDQVTKKHGVTKVTPITVVGERVFVGYNSERTTGAQIHEALRIAKTGEIKTLSQHLELARAQTVEVGGGCTGLSCEEGQAGEFVFELPYFGVIDLRSFSLISLSFVLGVIDGFNPCAMWVLITFLVLLSQAGSKKKMVFLAGIFILAQGIMYNLILNVWYKTWDFVALDQIVTPLVGFLAVGGALFFLWRWYKNREVQLVCDITDIDSQTKTINKFKQIVAQPITVTSIFAILAIAFSVNIIEFACSIGIPQAYTKILELNALTFLERQWYILIFSLGYMLDDVVVFGLAIWGYSKLQSHGGKYAQLSLLIGGILMLILGAVLVINPEILVL